MPTGKFSFSRNTLKMVKERENQRTITSCVQILHIHIPCTLSEVTNTVQTWIGGTFEDNLAPGSSDKQRLETMSPQNTGFCLPDSHAHLWELRPLDWQLPQVGCQVTCMVPRIRPWTKQHSLRSTVPQLLSSRLNQHLQGMPPGGCLSAGPNWASSPLTGPCSTHSLPLPAGLPLLSS